MNPEKKRGLPEFNGVIKNIVKSDEYRNLDEYRQTSPERIDAALFIKLHHRGIELLAIVFEFGLQFFDFGLKLLHLEHGAVGEIGQRGKKKFDEERQNDDGKSIIGHMGIKIRKDQE